MHCLLKANSKLLSRGCVDILYTAGSAKMGVKDVQLNTHFLVPSFAKAQVLLEKNWTCIFNLHTHISVLFATVPAAQCWCPHFLDAAGCKMW